MGRFYEDIKVLGGTVSIGTLTASNGSILEVNGTASISNIINDAVHFNTSYNETPLPGQLLYILL